MNQDVMDRILRCPSLPSLPAVAVRVIELTSNVEVSLEELASVIQNDQALAAKILRTVNSSFYGLRRPCANIGQALVMLGLAVVKSLALSFSLVSTLGSGSEEAFDFVAYWRRGLYTAVAAKCLARSAGVLQEDEAFLGGLLQDIGMVAMYRALGDRYISVIGDGDHRQLVQRELDELELQHPDVGAMLAQRWRLPAELIIPVRYHECPTAAPKEHAALVRCVSLGNIAHDVLTDADAAPAVRRFHARCLEWFDLDGEVADDLIKKIAESTRQLAPLFRLNTGEYADADQIVARAREQVEALAERGGEQEPTPDSFSGLLSDNEGRDALTGTLLPAVMGTRAQAAFTHAREMVRPVSAVHILLDGYDTLIAAGGPEAADAALVEAASLIDAQFGSKGGLVSRAGSSAFTVVMPGLDRVETFKIASALKEALRARSPEWTLPRLPPLPITISVGIATFEPRGGSPYSDVQMLLLTAKRAAQAASTEGGNCVRAFIPRAAAA